MISGTTRLIAHLGYPTESFKAPMIYNPYFEKHGIDAVVVPMGVRAEDYPAFLKLVFRLSNIHGALITMPHKVTTVGLLDEVTTTASVAGSCNAVRVDADGRLVGDMFDGEGFVRGVLRKGRALAGRQRARRRLGRRRLGDRRLARQGRRRAPRGLRRPRRRRWRASPAASAPHYPALEGRRPARTIRPASTSWSTRRRSA